MTTTCALLPTENEWVVSEILKDNQNITLSSWRLTELPGQQGITSVNLGFDVSKVRRVLPSLKENLDPMFVAVFEKQ
ncbi:hypothetical protein CO180_02245 [candidate division WWE3 bacterium CG_4_9_14_3_um_filter_41_6]|uniref:SAM-dependent MTase RsmB/NOP-type domain-containing protein n=1 Tax=candidate division WWE3 bacterium CG_4_10_14_0_2_um_filter_41_14 TaxID=1975072 RepID=A0A2M7TM06_UNCKA|nr:MAG: hypothetical protein COY32_00325 [candidate division WWE3 bacterium CG_4_10_14_0_2_um_filter_41_14]PJA38852.1 MAG: hypothetical protein CO180_02245 [candidate division WWE3 bacterium CG_4_9_14_3_um_filter_41_6]